MTVRHITTGSPLEERIGYSRAVVADGWVFVAGTTGYDYATMRMPESIVDQCRNTLATIDRALSEAGTRLDHVVRATYILPDPALWQACWPVLSEAFRKSPTGGHDDGRGFAGAGNEDRDRGHRPSALVNRLDLRPAFRHDGPSKFRRRS